MKTKTIMVLLLTFVVGMAFVGSSSAATYYVNPGDSIQAAINDATSGDTIFVHAGTYTENVLIDKSLTLQGDSADAVIVTNNTARTPVFEVTADYVNISGFSMTGADSGSSKAGIYLNSNQHCIISDNNAWSNGAGIYLMYSSNNTLVNNNASNNYGRCGIDLYDSSNNTLTNNVASDNYYGIVLSYSSNNMLTGNTVSSNHIHGIHLSSSSSNNTIYNNYFNNTVNVYNQGCGIWNITPTYEPNIIGGPYIGGNYWSDYIGEDTDGDGIGDTQTPYTTGILNGGDYHPLVLPIIDDGICYVYPGESIQEAIDAEFEGDPLYDTIRVMPGTYVENVVLHSPRVDLIGSPGAHIVAADPKVHTLEIQSYGNTISGFTISGATKNGAAGVYNRLAGDEGADLRNLTIVGNNIGLNIEGGIVYDTIIKDSKKEGVFSDGCYETNLHNVTVLNSGKRGVQISGCEGFTMNDCTVSGSGRDGIKVSGIYGVSICDTVVNDNGKNGISYYDCWDAGINDCTITGNGRSGIYARYSCAGFSRNEIAYNDRYGIKIMYSQDEVGENDIHDNRRGNIKSHGCYGQDGGYVPPP